MSTAERELLAQALSDAVTYRLPGDECEDCTTVPCGAHQDDARRADAYLALAGSLGVVVTP